MLRAETTLAPNSSRRNPRKGGNAFLYVVASIKDDAWGGPVKVGTTGNLKSRLRSIQTGSYTRLGYYRVWDAKIQEVAKYVERAFHKLYDKERLYGEWFAIDPELCGQYAELTLKTFMLSIGFEFATVEREFIPYQLTDE